MTVGEKDGGGVACSFRQSSWGLHWILMEVWADVRHLWRPNAGTGSQYRNWRDPHFRETMATPGVARVSE